MMRLVWKLFYSAGFIILLFFSGCGKRQVPTGELVEQAEALLNSGQIDGAILILERCQERDPVRVDVLEPLAFAYSAKDDPMMAAFTFKRIAELVPQQPEYLIYSAESLLEAEDFEGAVDRYQEYLGVQPKNRAVWVTLGELLASNGRTGEALEAYLAAEQIQSKSAQQIAIGELYLRSQNLAQAQSWFAGAVQGNSDTRDKALLGLLETAVRAKHFSEAEALLQQIDAEYPGKLDQSSMDSIRDQLAEWQKRREAAKLALAALESRTSELSRPVSPPARPLEPAEESVAPPAEESGEAPSFSVGEPIVNEAESTPESPEEVPAEEVVAEEVPKEIVASDYLARARELRTNGDMEEAVRQYKQALIQDDTQAWLWAELSETYLETGNDRWAQATANEALRRGPDDPKLILQFLRVAQRTMDERRVINEMENAYRRFPDQPGIVLVLARAYADQGNARNAYMLFSRYLDLVPETDSHRTEVEMEIARLRG